MSSALAYALADQRKRIEELERSIKELQERVMAIENKPKPGRPRKDEVR